MSFLTTYYPKRIEFELKGKNVFLRPPEYKDWKAWSSLKEKNKFYLKPWEPLWSPSELERSSFVKRVRFFEKLALDDSAYSFLIFESKTKNLIGEININNVQRSVVQSCSIGYWICEEKMGQGLMSEAINLIKKFIFDELDLHRLEAACLPVNKRSLRTLKNNGFAIEGLVRKYLKINGNWEDHLLLSCIKDESLWPFSIAPNTPERNILIARYGQSNLAQFKELYRSGLAQRYGKAMQIISGLHFNYSFSNSYLEKYNLNSSRSNDSSNDEIYLSVLRNIYRNNWLLLYLLGSSPVVSNNLLNKGENDAVMIDSEYSYFPNSTSIRMSDMGYQNTINEIDVSLSSVCEYTNSLRSATNKFCNSFSDISKESQISKNKLQIEDEYYSAARPKSSAETDERLANKLNKYGIQYVELRSIDINPFEPIGINLETILFLEIFMIYCSITDSPEVSKQEFKDIRSNDLVVSKYGKASNLQLIKFGNKIDLKSEAKSILNKMLMISELIDSIDFNYSGIISKKIKHIDDSSLCPSSIFLDRFLSSNLSYFDFGSHIAEENKSNSLMSKPLKTKNLKKIKKESDESIVRSRRLEDKDSVTFDTFLERYFEQ